ncbi:MAG: Hpt domain-containing protein [Proteobacteria bacterium]|nr:Hpt domain-containing protein [Pseudomonadota bacterium]
MTSVIDIGPLSWVKSEIDSSLERARASLKAYAAGPQDHKALKAAQTHLHQAYGAVQIVGLLGVSRFFEETERLVAEVEAGSVAAGPGVFDALDRAAQAIGKYLSDLLDGIPDQPLRLYPLHKELASLRGVKDVSEADLYFPDLSLQPPPREEPPVRLSAADMETYLRGQRARFQRGFLKWLKEPADKASIADMLAAVDGIESTQLAPSQRAFWWAAGAFYQALADGGLAPEPGVRLACSKIEQQMRRTTDGGPAVSERLMREVLYWIARASISDFSTNERVREAKQAFRLEGSLPSVEHPADQSQRMQTARALREQISGAKEAWNRFASGGETSLAVFARHADAVRDHAAQMGSAELAALAREIAVIAAYLVTNPAKMSEPVGMEVATALLLVESAAENYARLAPEFSAQARVMLARLRAAAFGKQDPDVTLAMPVIDDMTRRAQEKLAIDGTVAEMQANLLKIEQALDAYFRDPARAAELAALEPSIHQVSGALAMLGEDEAGAALARCREKILGFARAATRPEQREFEEVAQILSGLGFFIDALRHGKADFAAAMQPFVAEATVVPPPAPAEPEAPEAPEELEQPEVDITPPIEAPSAEAQRLKGESDEAIDQELLAIFLEEAEGVLESIAQGLATSRAQPSDLGVLTTIRRGFHTLKGSGRMVGLLRLGEAAWAVEQVMNLWQQEERAANETLFEFIAYAHGVFADWVARLQGGQPQPDPQPIVELAERVKRSAAAQAEAAPQPAAAAPEAPAPREPGPAPAPEGVVRIGGLAISASLFAVFANEARQHLETLERELAQVAAGRTAGVRDELVRAAHTLAGICGTVQLKGMHDLGAAFENALLRLKNRPAPVTAGELALANDSVQALKMMYAGVLERAVPGTATALIARLGAITGEAAVLATPDVEEPAVAEPELAESPAGELAGAPAEAPAEDRRQRRLEDEIDAQLLPIFLEEANELVPQIGELLRAWRAAPADFDPARAMQRALHTLKGSARMAGAMGLGELTHNMETRVENAIALNLTPGQFFDDLETSYDRIGLLLERVQHPRAPEEAAPPEVREAPPATQAGPAVREAVAPREEAKVHAMMRVRADVLEKLVNEAGEVAITRTRIETEMHGLKAALGELTENVARLRRELREIEIAAESQLASRMQATQLAEGHFDPLEFDRFTRFQELTRMMAESVNDVSTVQQTLNKVADDTDAALAAQARLNRELQQDLMRIRMVPIGSIVERLHRIVRQTSKELGKRANLDIRGVNVELDRSALERMTGPLEHLLRNAITHGLEMPDARVAEGKAAMGEIALEVRQEGNEVTLVLADDGAGLHLGRIREKATARGLLQPGESRSDQQLAELIFTPGLSTAETVTELAGRGVGLDVVMSEVSALGGRIELASTPGQGTRFTIRLPLTTAVIQAVLVKVGSRTYALPSVMVEQVQQMRQEPLQRARAAGAIEWAGRRYPLHHLPALLGEAAAPAPAEQRRYTPVLLVRSGVEAIAVEVDDMLGNQEVVVKNIGPQLASVPGIAGATVLGTGEIVMILNPVPLAARPAAAYALVTSPHVQASAVPVQPCVMVVDDSLTVRKITGRLLAREGYRVVTARDGVEALELLAESVPDVMLVDVEMPRMDGFDLTRNVRADARLKGVPIIMITSRTADKHRNYATELGVNVFLGKPYQEEELLSHIAAFVGRS